MATAMPGAFLTAGKIRLGAAVDHVGIAVGKRLANVGQLDLDRAARETGQAQHLYEQQGWLGDPSSFHPQVPTGFDGRITTGRWRSLGFSRLRLLSGYTPHSGEPGRERWLARQRNNTLHLRVFRHAEWDRPWVVCLHGTGMGLDGLDFQAFDVAWLHRQLGFNVAVPVLPLCGPRRQEGGPTIQFPTNDPLDSVHGLAQLIWELRRIVAWLRDQGASDITIEGISLGGYSAALAACLVPGVDRVVAGIPASDLPRLYLDHTPGDLLERHRPVLELSRQIHRVVSPLDLSPALERDRLFIFAARGDRMVPVRSQARPIWEHWGRPSTCWYPGGHVAFVRSAKVRRFLNEAMGGVACR